jgi:hypothetical protein
VKSRLSLPVNLQHFIRLSDCLVKHITVPDFSGQTCHGFIVKNHDHGGLMRDPIPLTVEAVPGCGDKTKARIVLGVAENYYERAVSLFYEDKSVPVLYIILILKYIAGQTLLPCCFVYIDAKTLITRSYLLRCRT